MERIKSYDLPHKALRAALGKISFLAGKTNYKDFSEVQTLSLLFNEVFDMLRSHAEDENNLLLARLEMKEPGSSTHDIQDHEHLELIEKGLQDALANLLTRAKANQANEDEGYNFYLSFSEFQSLYLSHLLEEERVTQSLLWKYFTEEELIEQRKLIISKMTLEKLLFWIKYAIPAQNFKERTEFLKGVKITRPLEFLLDAWELIKKELPEDEMVQLSNALGITI